MSEYKGPEYDGEVLYNKEKAKIGIIRRILDWFFFAFGNIMFLALVFEIFDSAKGIVSLLLFGIFTISIMPINPIIDLWTKVIGKKWKIIRPILLIAIFFAGTVFLPPTESYSNTKPDDEKIVELKQDVLEKKETKPEMLKTDSVKVEEPQPTEEKVDAPKSKEIKTEKSQPTEEKVEESKSKEIKPKKSQPTEENAEASKSKEVKQKKSKTKEQTEKASKESSTNKSKTKAKSKENEVEKILGKEGYANFKEAASEISMDVSKIYGFEQIDNWASGPRYSFTYLGQQVILYMLETNYVNGINTGGWQVYKDGLEPLNINDFIVNSSVYSQLQLDSEKAVKSVLNHPNTANFDWWTTGACSRAGEYYIVSAQVKAKNSFGVKDTISFKTEYRVKDSKYSRIYFECDGTVRSGKYVDPLAERGRAESKISVDVSESGFVLVDGQLGEYGKWYDERNEIIFYYVPEGTYKVTAINKGEAYVSIPGNDEDCDVYTFKKAGDVQTITIPKGNIVQLMINTSLRFEQQ